MQPLSRCSLVVVVCFVLRKCFWFVFLSSPLLFHHDDDDELMLNVLRCHLTY